MALVLLHRQLHGIRNAFGKLICTCLQNLPIGGLAAAIVLFSLKASPPLGSEAGDRSSKSLWEQTRRMDWAGGLLCLGSITALVLALQWGGNQKPWSSSAVVIVSLFRGLWVQSLILVSPQSFVIFGVSALALGVWQWWLGDEGMVPFSILRVRSALAIVHFNDLCRFSFLILTYVCPWADCPSRATSLCFCLWQFIPIFYRESVGPTVSNLG